MGKASSIQKPDSLQTLPVGKKSFLQTIKIKHKVSQTDTTEIGLFKAHQDVRVIALIKKLHMHIGKD